ncbi:hypothetical protein LBMAG48_26830 [Phycisphaerae bacterium]|nr:hypothetical protein LBMAG48_26830 [Phycisphaerae bacterium]
MPLRLDDGCFEFRAAASSAGIPGKLVDHVSALNVAIARMRIENIPAYHALSDWQRHSDLRAIRLALQPDGTHPIRLAGQVAQLSSPCHQAGFAA